MSYATSVVLRYIKATRGGKKRNKKMISEKDRG